MTKPDRICGNCQWFGVNYKTALGMEQCVIVFNDMLIEGSHCYATPTSAERQGAWPACSFFVLKESLRKEALKSTRQLQSEKFTLARKILRHLNQVACRRFKMSNTTYLRSIVARLDEEYIEEDFKLVHFIKVKQWRGTDMAKYIRPSTLYHPKHFDEYLQEGRERETEIAEQYGKKSGKVDI